MLFRSNSRITEAEEWISDLEDRMVEFTAAEKNKEKRMKTNEEEIGSLPEKEFRIMIVKMIQDLGIRMEAKIEKMQEMINKNL